MCLFFNVEMYFFIFIFSSLYLFDPSNLPPGNLHNNNNNNIMIKPPTHVPRSKKYDKTKTSMRNNENCDGNESNSLTHSVIMENQTTNSSTEGIKLWCFG